MTPVRIAEVTYNLKPSDLVEVCFVLVNAESYSSDDYGDNWDESRSFKNVVDAQKFTVTKEELDLFVRNVHSLKLPFGYTPVVTVILPKVDTKKIFREVVDRAVEFANAVKKVKAEAAAAAELKKKERAEKKKKQQKKSDLAILESLAAKLGVELKK